MILIKSNLIWFYDVKIKSNLIHLIVKKTIYKVSQIFQSRIFSLYFSRTKNEINNHFIFQNKKRNSSQKSSQSQPSSQQTVSSDPSSQQTLSETSFRNSSQSSQPLNDLLIIRLDEQILGKEDFNHERVVALLPGRTVDILIR